MWISVPLYVLAFRNNPHCFERLEYAIEALRVGGRFSLVVERLFFDSVFGVNIIELPLQEANFLP
jgi:hypothetical protein